MPENEIIVPDIPHADVSLYAGVRIIVRMDLGWVFWDRRDYTDENGNMYDPDPSEIGYSRFGIYPVSYDFSTFVVVDESTVPSNQIHSSPNPPVITE